MQLDPTETTLDSIVVYFAKREIPFVYLLDEAIEVTLEQLLKYLGTAVLFMCVLSIMIVNVRISKKIQYAEQKFDGIRSERKLEIEF